MLMYPDIDPVAFQLGPLAVHWYGLMYGLGFLGAYLLGRSRSRHAWTPVQPKQMEDLLGVAWTLHLLVRWCHQPVGLDTVLIP